MSRGRSAVRIGLLLVASALACKQKGAQPPQEGKAVTRAGPPPASATPVAAPATAEPAAAAPLPSPAVAPAAPAPTLALQAPVDIGLPKTLVASSSSQVARIVWQNLDKLKNGCGKDLAVADFPGGTARTFGCSLFSVLPDGALAVLSGKAVVVSGPHQVLPPATGGEGGLVLASARDFGRYNPEFVQWAVDTLVPGATDDAFRLATQPLFDRFVRPLARVFLVVREEMDREPARLQFERRSFRAALTDQDGVSEL